ncbi:MAG TPA: phosphotransferase [Pseudogracilibacillus sp.]|nr:phosphotransferase [Pseudogracilibacillus sp.]
MNSDFLQAAKAHQKKQEYKKAVTCFQSYMKEHTAPYEEKFYKDYAKCLRLIGETRHAEAILQEGREEHPESVVVLKESSALYEVMGDWNKAKTCSEKLIQLEPETPAHHIRLGGIYAQLKETQEAENAYQDALTYQHGMDMEELMSLVQQRIAEQPASIQTHYVHMGGMNNLGAFIHETEQGKYMTKIAVNKGANKREAFFYEEIVKTFPVLQDIVPTCLDSFVQDNILYITMEWKAGKFAGLEQFPEVLEMHEKLASIPYNDIVDLFHLPSYKFQFNLRNPNIVTQFFTQIHKENVNRQLFKSLRTLVEQKETPATVDFLITRLESFVLDNQLYLLVEPERHYTLLHGEYKPGTIIIEEGTAKGYVIDWSTFTIGPPCVEIARYLSAELPSYSKIQEIYLHHEKRMDQLTFVERIFFLYAMVVFYILRFIKSKNTATREKITQFITEVLNELEKLIELHRPFLEDRYRLIQLQQELSTSEQEIRTLKKKNKQLKKQLTQTYNSKSWKATAPLRKVAERWRK